MPNGQFNHGNSTCLHDGRVHGQPADIPFLTELYYEANYHGQQVREWVRCTGRQAGVLLMERRRADGNWYGIGRFPGLVPVAMFLSTLRVNNVTLTMWGHAGLSYGPIRRFHAYTAGGPQQQYLGNMNHVRRSFCRVHGYAQ